MRTLPFFNALLLAATLLSCRPSQDNNAPAESPQATPVAAPEASDPDYDPEARLRELGIELKLPAAPAGNYVNAVRTGNLLFLAGKGPMQADGTYLTGKVGADLTQEQGYEAARLTAISQLAVLKAELGDLKRVRRIVKVLGMVNATSDFTNQPEVINGFSDLMVAVFGARGKHARAAVGMASLPRGIAVEVELIVEVEPD
jgi:enamine deaminase RidA (YjgF/YER057c/UK114 family)